MLEAPIEQDSVDYAEARGWLVRKLVYLGRRGSPDRWFFKGGFLLLVEFKRPKKDAEAQQRREHRKFREAGFPVYVIDSFEEFKERLHWAEREIERRGAA